MSPFKITLASGAVITLTFTGSAYPVFDNVNKILTLFGESAHATSIAVFTGVAQYTSSAFTVS